MKGKNEWMIEDMVGKYISTKFGINTLYSV